MIARGATLFQAYVMPYNLNNSQNWLAQKLKTLKAVGGLREQVNLLECKYSRILITSSLVKVLVPLKSSLWLGTVLFPISHVQINVLIKSSPCQTES